MDYLLVAVLNRFQPSPRPPTWVSPGLRPPPSQLIENHYCDLEYGVNLTVIKAMEIIGVFR